MRRRIIQDLCEWQQTDEHLPLLLRGARQVGKSYIVESFGSKSFESCVTLNFEFKFSRNTIGVQVIDDVKEKIERLKTPKQYFCRPVLIHVNGVSDELLDSHYFSHVLNMSELFE